MTLTKITPAEARARIAEGAALVDIRAADEHARSRIPGALNAPLGSAFNLGDAPAVIYHCRSGMRTDANAAQLAAASPCEAYLLEGGIEAWRAAGLPIITDAKAPLEIMRQVQITAGLLVLIGVIGALTVTPWLVGLSAFVGAGLTFAGVTGWCGMAKLLALMPWNRRAAA
ncbi:MAG: rhodanese family protein [Pseudomonadota bacterium]|nr:rhodanese family protein [Pseudomonadota bacterium]